MSFQDKLQQIDDLQLSIKKHGKLAEPVLKKINYKFRLDWNYHSNSMEGNSLTRQETRSVMVGNITVEGKPIQDVLEMRQHDDLITGIIKMGKGELNISEKRIKEIHAAIMYEEDPEKKKQIGHWKKQPNHLHNYKGERFDFAEPAEVPERMHALVNWLNAEKEKIQRGDEDALHPVFLAFKFHLDYVTIHPFYDGNGRTSRILSNIILISYGYPPIYVKTDERNIYYQYLADIQAYGGQPDLFYEFMAGLIIRSQEIVLNAIAGRDIEEPDDLIKEISIWKNQLESTKFEAKSNSHIIELYTTGLDSFFELYLLKMRTAFRELFAGWQEIGSVNNTSHKGKEFIDGRIQALTKVNEEVIEEAKKGTKYIPVFEDINSLSLKIFMQGFTRDKTNTFSVTDGLEIEFQPFKYLIKRNQKELLEKLYSEKINLYEQTEIVNIAVKDVFERIKLNIVTK